MLRLNLGSGDHSIDGFSNVDARKLAHASDGDISNLVDIADGSVDYIYCAHALQCLPNRGLVLPTLKEWFRVLLPSGILNIEVPNSMPLLADYVRGRAKIESLIQGMYGVNEDGLRQTICFDYDLLYRLLHTHAGFVNVHQGPQACYSRHDARTNLVVYCRKP